MDQVENVCVAYSTAVKPANVGICGTAVQAISAEARLDGRLSLPSRYGELQNRFLFSTLFQPPQLIHCHMDILAWKQHDTFYFVDGNICLCALSSQSSTTTQAARADANTADTLRNPKPAGFIFRVHRTVLSLHSPVFKDMFNMPDLRASSEAYDGVALVRMPDTAEDLESLLSAFYFG